MGQYNINLFLPLKFTVQCSLPPCIKDFVITTGMSKATLTLQKLNKKFVGVDQRAIFFALLNPQPNGAGFAGKGYINIRFFRDFKRKDNNRFIEELLNKIIPFLRLKIMV